MQTKIKIDIRKMSNDAKAELAKYFVEFGVMRKEFGIDHKITECAPVTWNKDNASFLYIDENKRITTGYSLNKFASHPFKVVKFAPAKLA